MYMGVSEFVFEIVYVYICVCRRVNVCLFVCDRACACVCVFFLICFL